MVMVHFYDQLALIVWEWPRKSSKSIQMRVYTYFYIWLKKTITLGIDCLILMYSKHFANVILYAVSIYNINCALCECVSLWQMPTFLTLFEQSSICISWYLMVCRKTRWHSQWRQVWPLMDTRHECMLKVWTNKKMAAKYKRWHWVEWVYIESR